MADILDFRTAEGRSEKGARRAMRASPCEIVIFPGVRYERWETAPQEKPKPSRKRVERDTLELTD